MTGAEVPLPYAATIIEVRGSIPPDGQVFFAVEWSAYYALASIGGVNQHL